MFYTVYPLTSRRSSSSGGISPIAAVSSISETRPIQRSWFTRYRNAAPSHHAFKLHKVDKSSPLPMIYEDRYADYQIELIDNTPKVSKPFHIKNMQASLPFYQSLKFPTVDPDYIINAHERLNNLLKDGAILT